MDEKSNPEIEPRIDRAQKQLAEAVDEACKMDIRRADTGQLIRVEEALDAAARAAKDAVSLRLKRRTERQADAAVQQQVASDAKQDHRTFVDRSGVVWAVFAVRPSNRSVEAGSLPEKFNQGWLSFEHGDEVRRFAPVPEDWQSLADLELRQLWDQADISVKRITTLQTPEEKLK
ncbi:MAG TPA: hypothetical protein VJ867_00775 [Gemmatimonadaceae bacterium]|nr:hypothetical protein [Gemmatimonadaceae bacterium]